MNRGKQLTRQIGLMLAIAAIFGTVAPGISNADEDDLNDIGALTCRDVLLATGEERDAVVIALHAYLLGEAKQLTYDADVLADATDRFLDACIDEPDAKALATMRKQVKSTD